MKAELIANMQMADYLAIDAASSGGLKVLATRSPKAYRERVKDSTPAQTLGTLAHLAILEPDAFADVAVMPECDRRTNAGKGTLVDWLTEIVGEPTVRPPAKAATGAVLDLYLGELLPRLDASQIVTASQSDYAMACGMRDAMMARSDTRAILEADGLTEVTGLADDPDFEVPCKVRPDKLIAGYYTEVTDVNGFCTGELRRVHPTIISLKTCQSVGERDYLRTAWTYGYPGAAWFYRRILEAITGEPHRYWEIAVESAPPHDAMIVEYTQPEIDEAAGTMRRGLELYRRCLDSGIWPGSGWDWDQMDYVIRAIGRTE